MDHTASDAEQPQREPVRLRVDQAGAELVMTLNRVLELSTTLRRRLDESEGLIQHLGEANMQLQQQRESLQGLLAAEQQTVREQADDIVRLRAQFASAQRAHLEIMSRHAGDVVLPFLCKVVAPSAGPNGEPLACAFSLGHTGPHSWSTLPSWDHVREVLDQLRSVLLEAGGA